MLASSGFVTAQPAPPETKPPYTVIGGTVFTQSGFSLPGASLTLLPTPGTVAGHKIKKQRAISDSRGEWAMRVPPEPMSYTLEVSRKGFRPETAKVTVEGEYRKDVTIQLREESKE